MLEGCFPSAESKGTVGKARRAITIALALLLLAGSVGVFLRLRGYRARAALDYSREIERDISLLFTDTTLVGRRDGKKLWEIRAKTIRISRDQVRTLFEGIEDGTLYQNDRPLFKLKAGKASYNNAYRDLSIEGGVQITSTTGIALRCNAAYWSTLKNRVTCPGKVEVLMANGKLVGQDLESDSDLKQMVLHHIRLSVKLPGNEEALQP